MGFLAKGALMATSGANGAVIWPFRGANGPMGEQAAEIAHDDSTMVARVAGTPEATVLAAGLEDGRVWVADLRTSRQERLKADKGAPITALAVTPRGDRVAFGDEDGGAAVLAAPL
jgi:hypothetical protein